MDNNTNKVVIKIGLDVHSTNYTACAVECQIEGNPKFIVCKQFEPNMVELMRFYALVKKKYEGQELDITFGYEAGCLGFTLCRDLEKHHFKCFIMAPSTMSTPKGPRIKTDKRDARMIAECLASGGFHAVHVPTPEDEEVRNYLRMRADHQNVIASWKQRINAFALKLGHKYTGKTKWTAAHLKWLRELKLSDLNRLVLDEYLLTYSQLTEKIERLDKYIEEQLATKNEYQDKVSKLRCFIGIETYTALSVIVETSDFSRFAKGNAFSAYVGLVPGESSSSDSIKRLPITKAGNGDLRRILIEAAQCICRGRVGYKSKKLIARQAGVDPKYVAYADRANERLRRRFLRMVLDGGKQRNVAVTAIARELACFIWGMMTDQIA